ncbi:Protein H06I04.3 a [Aphelenchoides avenae]|nr:Protein H06I04.3 a [Aphelenchus avenae]
MLCKANRVILDDEKLASSPHTTEEVKECMKDIKVCGPRELRTILSWRKKILGDIVKERKLAAQANGERREKAEEDPEEKERRELEEIEEHLRNATAEEKSKLKKKKRQMLKEKAKQEQRKKLKMVHEGDEPMISEDLELFSLARIRKALERSNKTATRPTSKAADADTDGEEQYPSGDEDETGADEGTWEVAAANADDASDDSDVEEDEEKLLRNDIIQDDETGLSQDQKAAPRSEKWFARKEIAELLEDDDEDELDAIEKHMKRTMNKDKLHANTVSFDDAAKPKESDDEEETTKPSAFKNDQETLPSDDEAEDGDRRAAKRKNGEKDVPEKKKRRLTPEQLAMGELMIYSSKTRKDLEDWAWNRYASNDTGLPDWFVEDEKHHCRKEPPVSQDRIAFYKERTKALNTRPIKKVMEAKMRKKKRQVRRLEKAKKKAENIIENDNLEHGEKIREMKKVYRKAMTNEKKDVKYTVMTKGKQGRMGRPSGRYKVVDRRLKSDTRKLKMQSRQKGKKSGKSRGHR